MKRADRAVCSVWRKHRSQDVSVPMYTLRSLDMGIPRPSSCLRLQSKPQTSESQRIIVVRRPSPSRASCNHSQLDLLRSSTPSVSPARHVRRLSAGTPYKSMDRRGSDSPHDCSLFITFDKTVYKAQAKDGEQTSFHEDSVDRLRRRQQLKKGCAVIRRTDTSPNHFLSKPTVKEVDCGSYPPPIAVHSVSNRPGPVVLIKKRPKVSTRWKKRLEERLLASKVRKILKPDLGTDRNFRLVP